MTTHPDAHRAVHPQDTSPHRWKRDQSAQFVIAYQEAASKAQSQRQFAREQGIPRTTLQYWLTRHKNLDASPAFVEFFESPEGIAFLHRLVIALHFVMGMVHSSGLRSIEQVIELAGLSGFVANSFGTHQKTSISMQHSILEFEQQERTRLASEMPPRQISLCQDETFHPEICLVATEPVSNFIVLEKYVERRDAQTWTEQLKQALAGLPVTVIQSTSDEAQGILAHVRHSLGAHHSPDLFHVQQTLSQSMLLPLSSKAHKAQEEAEQAKDRLEAKQQRALLKVSQDLGKLAEEAACVAKEQVALQEAEQTLEQALKQKEHALQVVRGLGKDYHPVDLETGSLCSASEVEQHLEEHFAKAREIAQEAELSESCLQGIQKAYRVLPAMVATLTFFEHQVQQRLQALDLSPQLAELVHDSLVPSAYLERAAHKAPSAEERTKRLELAQRLRSAPEVTLALAALDPEQREAIEQAACECADVFQRSSSCVEGRNGQLSLGHHSLHALSEERLRALTVVHNYFIRRPDGTTAAERFFGQAPGDLFAWLLDHLALPARPAKKRRPQEPVPLLN